MKEKIIETLEGIKVPSKNKSLQDLGWVSDVSFCDGVVKITMQRGDLTEPEKVALDRTIETEVKNLGGIKQVNLVTVSAPSGPIPLPSHTAPKPQPKPKGIPEKQSIPGVKHIIAVASGKGGVGKSTVAVNLASALMALGKKVGICDSDIYGPSMPLMLGIQERPQANDRQKIIPLEKNGLKVMSIGFLLEADTAVIWRGPMVMQMIKQFLREVEWGELDYLVLDLPPGTGDAQLTIVQTIPLTGAIIVTTPNDIALIDARRGLAMFREVSVPVFGLVENMSVFECPHCHKTTHIFDEGGGKRTAQELEVPFLVEIPIDTKIRRGGDTGAPVAMVDPKGSSAQVFFKLANIILQKTGEEASEKKSGLFQSIFSKQKQV